MSRDLLPVGCFGKLPFWPEYLEVGAGLETARALREWVHQGRAEAGLVEEGEDRPDVELWTHWRLLIGTPGSKDLLVGVMRPSKGAGGREFPFTVFTHVPRREYGKHYALLPLGLGPVWEELEDAWLSLASLATRDAFRETIGSFEVSRPAPIREIRAAFEAGQIDPLDGLFDRTDGANLDTLLAELPGAMGRLKQRGNRGLNLCLPVSRDARQACFDAAMWIDLVNRQFFMRRFEPCLILDASAKERERVAFFKYGALGPADYAALLSNGGGELAADLDRPAHGSGGQPSSAGGDSSPVTTYAELLSRKFPSAP